MLVALSMLGESGASTHSSATAPGQNIIRAAKSMIPKFSSSRIILTSTKMARLTDTFPDYLRRSELKREGSSRYW